MKRFNVVTVRVYEKNGEEKKQWNTVGSLVAFDNGGYALDLHMFPGTKFFVFDQEKDKKGVDPIEYPKSSETAGETEIIEDAPF